jgi:hypothetical protein
MNLILKSSLSFKIGGSLDAAGFDGSFYATLTGKALFYSDYSPPFFNSSAKICISSLCRFVSSGSFLAPIKISICHAIASLLDANFLKVRIV